MLQTRRQIKRTNINLLRTGSWLKTAASYIENARGKIRYTTVSDIAFDYNNIHDLAAYLEEKYAVRNTPAAAFKEKRKRKSRLKSRCLNLYIYKKNG